jgi:hypothetical protein
VGISRRRGRKRGLRDRRRQPACWSPRIGREAGESATPSSCSPFPSSAIPCCPCCLQFHTFVTMFCVGRVTFFISFLLFSCSIGVTIRELPANLFKFVTKGNFVPTLTIFYSSSFSQLTHAQPRTNNLGFFQGRLAWSLFSIFVRVGDLVVSSFCNTHISLTN